MLEDNNKLGLIEKLICSGCMFLDELFTRI